MEQITISSEEKKLLERFTGYGMPEVLDWNGIMALMYHIEGVDINQFAKQLNREESVPIEGHFWIDMNGEESAVRANVYYWQTDNLLEGLTQNFSEGTKIKSVFKALIEFLNWFYKHNGQYQPE